MQLPKNTEKAQNFEDQIEQSYWRFDAKRSGYSIWQETPMSERDAFKSEMRKMLRGQSIAIQSILAERHRQVQEEGWTPKWDDEQHKDGSLARAAAVYANPEYWDIFGCGQYIGWPWDAVWWKPTDTRRNLVKAAALIIAEIERLDRKENE